MVTHASARRVRIVIQARTTSSRLPAKVLLPVGGIPLAVLVAKRAARNGADVVVATSGLPEDDILALYLEKYAVRSLRGPLDDVLERFRLATEDLDAAAICVRLTADNPVPDADYIDQLVQLFIASGLDYLAYGNDGMWMPYGLSAELFTVGSLRDAARNAGSPFEREHVTPWIRRKQEGRVRPAFPDWSEDLGHLRCTIDRLDDYLKVAGIFSEFPDAVAIRWRQVVDRLKASSTQPRKNAELVLGTVQLGLEYGAANRTGLPSDEEANAILETALRRGVAWLDTAHAYGKSEKRIGAFSRSLPAGEKINVVTKLDPLSDLDLGEEPRCAVARVEKSVEMSLTRLGLSSLPVLLMHRATHLTDFGGAIWRQLLKLRETGVVERLGVSVQTPEELSLSLTYPEITHIQLPFNLLDWRWDNKIVELRQRPDVSIHARSVFLQGLLIQENSTVWPSIAGVDAANVVQTLRALKHELNRESLQDLCIAYARSVSWIDGLVIGVDTTKHLEMLCSLWSRPPLSYSEACVVKARLPRLPVQFLNPALWPR
ncbi:aldo/keto reductase [Pseudomonas sp. R2.Fl]|nr:aldo/keto reductase [Pseudomonas sp. R2.Fl]